MRTNLRLAITADLHWGVRPAGDEATRLLVDFLKGEPPDVLILAGDIGAGDDFGRCLCLFADLKCRKALVPGNHDIWVENNDPRGDSLQVYREHLPQLAAAYSCIYLDQQPLYLPEADLAVVGSINWYDYSWSLDTLRRNMADWEDRLKTKRFTRGRHNDARFVRWPLDDVRFTREVVTKLEQDLLQVLTRVGQAIVITHHPPFYGLGFPRPNSPVLVDSLLWDAFSGNCAVEELLLRHMERIPLTLCGHTHRARENNLGAIRGYNIGGDYHFKRLLLVDWPVGSVEAHVFGDPQI